MKHKKNKNYLKSNFNNLKKELTSEMKRLRDIQQKYDTFLQKNEHCARQYVPLFIVKEMGKKSESLEN